MTIIEPEPLEIALFPDQIEKLEHAAEKNPEAENIKELLQIVVADYTGTFSQLRTPYAHNVAKTRDLHERIVSLLEEVSDKIESQDDAELAEISQRLDEIKHAQNRISKEQRVIH